MSPDNTPSPLLKPYATESIEICVNGIMKERNIDRVKLQQLLAVDMHDTDPLNRLVQDYVREVVIKAEEVIGSLPMSPENIESSINAEIDRVLPRIEEALSYAPTVGGASEDSEIAQIPRAFINVYDSATAQNTRYAGTKFLLSVAEAWELFSWEERMKIMSDNASIEERMNMFSRKNVDKRHPGGGVQ